MLGRLVTLLAVLTAGVGGLVMGAGELRAARASRSWPSVPAIIERSDPSNSESCVSFTYRVAGQSYTATTVWFGEERVTTGGRQPSCRESVTRRYPAGTAVEARFNPNEPSYAVLEPGPHGGSYIPLGFGVLFTLAGGLFLWNQTAGWRLWRRVQSGSGREETAEEMRQPIDPAAWSVTPSEVVAIHGTRFAVSTPGGNIRLMDGSKVGAQQLLRAELAAAILANEHAGALRLELSENPTPRLEIVPTGVAVSWPSHSAESRLQQAISERGEVSVVVRQWLGHPSSIGWSRGAEKVHLALVLRGLATVRQAGRRRRYVLADEGARAAAAVGLPGVQVLLRRCESERPVVWQRLLAGMTSAVEGYDPPPGDLLAAYAGMDPWYDEAASVRKSVPGLTLFGDVKATGRELFIWGTILWSVVGAAAYLSSSGGRIALGTGIVASTVLFAAAVAGRRPWIAAVSFRWPRLQPLLASFEREWPKAAVTVIPLVGLTIAGGYAFADSLAVVVATMAGIAIVSMFLLRSMAREAITRQVVAAPPLPSAAVREPSADDIHAVARPSVAPLSTSVPLLDLRVVKPIDLPDVSEHARARIDAIRNRGRLLRRLFRDSAVTIAVGSLAIALLAWWLLSPDTGAKTFPWFTTVLVAVTLLVLFKGRQEESSLGPAFWILRHTLRYVRGGAALERSRWEREITPIRPVIAPVLRILWAVFTVVRSLTYLGSSTSAKWVPIVLSVVLVAASALRLRRGRKALESRYPVYSPLRLLTLRVFGGPTRFVQLLDLWHWFGPLYRLDGPDTAGSKTSDVLAYATGRLDAAITEDAAELDQALRTFTETRDSQLRFRFNSLQCSDRIWKDALHRLIERADVVVMDLSGFTERNRGCAYEIGRLVHHVPLERVLLLIDDETDLDGVRQLLGEVTAGQSGVATAQQLRLFHLGSQPIRREHESVYEWQRRATSPIDAERLIGLLCDAACANRPTPNPTAIRWSKPGYRSAPAA